MTGTTITGPRHHTFAIGRHPGDEGNRIGILERIGTLPHAPQLIHGFVENHGDTPFTIEVREGVAPTGAVTFTPVQVADVGVAATGNVDLTGLPTDDDTLILDDGLNPAVTYEFDNDSSVTETATLQQVVIGGSAAITIANFISKVNTPAAGAIIAITASAGAGDSADLVNDIFGVAGNVAITDAFDNGTVTGMASGVSAEVIVIDSGPGAAITFEFDDDASVIETAILRQVVIGATVGETVQNFVTAVANSALAMTTRIALRHFSSEDIVVELTNAEPGTAGNVTITTTANPEATVTGMAGGTGGVLTIRDASATGVTSIAVVPRARVEFTIELDEDSLNFLTFNATAGDDAGPGELTLSYTQGDLELRTTYA